MSPIVEFCGLPGSGKSTLAHNLMTDNRGFIRLAQAVLLCRAGISPSLLPSGSLQRRTGLWGLLRKAENRLAHTLSRNAQAPGCPPQENIKASLKNDNAALWIQQTSKMYCSLSPERLAGRRVLVEEGVVQRLYAAYPDSPPPPRTPLSLIPTSSSLLFVDTPPDEAYFRLQKRVQASGGWDVGRFAGLSSAQVRRDLHHNYDHLRSTLLAAQHSGVVVHVVPGTLTPGEAALIASALLSPA